MKPLLSVEHLDLVFGTQPQAAFAALDLKKSRTVIQTETTQIVAVNQAHFDVHTSEILVLMGLSGSGKSSLLRCLNGLNGRPNPRGENRGTTRGHIYFHQDQASTDLLSCTHSALRELRKNHITMVFQQVGLMPWRTIRENVAFPLQLKKIDKPQIYTAVQEKLALVGLTDWADRYPHELSGGMKQRVGLARAFVTEADLLLMDEPFSALDPFHRKNLQEEILKLQKQLKKTIVFVTHDPDEALRLADRIAILEEGQILALETPTNLLATQDPAVRRILGTRVPNP